MSTFQHQLCVVDQLDLPNVHYARTTGPAMTMRYFKHKANTLHALHALRSRVVSFCDFKKCRPSSSSPVDSNIWISVQASRPRPDLLSRTSLFHCRSRDAEREIHQPLLAGWTGTTDGRAEMGAGGRPDIWTGSPRCF